MFEGVQTGILHLGKAAGHLSLHPPNLHIARTGIKKKPKKQTQQNRREKNEPLLRNIHAKQQPPEIAEELI